MTDSASSQLRVHVVQDHDGECSVTATLVAGVFRGEGRAWLDIADVSVFTGRAKQLASSSAGEAILSGGYVNPDGTPDFTVKLVFRPHGNRGHIILAAELSSGPSSMNSPAQSVSRMSAALIIEPAALERFSLELSNIPKGESIEASLLGECAV
jgi:hypothetical protein